MPSASSGDGAPDAVPDGARTPMTALPVPRPEDVYDAETLAGFRAAG